MPTPALRQRHITAASALTPSPQLLLQRGLMHQHAETRRRSSRPCSCGGGEPARVRAGGTRGRQRPVDRAAARGSHGRSVRAHADRGGVDDDVAVGDIVGVTDAHRVHPPGLQRPRRAQCRRLTTMISAAPARASASMTDRAAPPAPSTQTRRPSRSTSAAAQRGDEAVAVGAVPLQPAVGESARPC